MLQESILNTLSHDVSPEHRNLPKEVPAAKRHRVDVPTIRHPSEAPSPPQLLKEPCDENAAKPSAGLNESDTQSDAGQVSRSHRSGRSDAETGIKREFDSDTGSLSEEVEDDRDFVTHVKEEIESDCVSSTESRGPPAQEGGNEKGDGPPAQQGGDGSRDGLREGLDSSKVKIFEDEFDEDARIRVEDDFLKSFLDDVKSVPKLPIEPPQSSGLLSSGEEVGRSRDLIREFELDEVSVEWKSGQEEADRIINLVGAEMLGGNLGDILSSGGGGGLGADGLPANGLKLFEIFNVPINASEELIKRHFKKLSLLLHPDKCRYEKASQAFFIVKKAYDELLKPEYRTKYIDVIQEAKFQVIQEINLQNKIRKINKQTPLPTDSLSIRQATILKCDQLVKDRQERIAYAEQTKKQNELREQAMRDEEAAEEYKKQLDRKKWEAQRDERAGNWRAYRSEVLRKKLKVDIDPTVHESRKPLDETYKKAWR